VLFQASTIGALLDGAYDGDVTFAELAGHGDLGLGTLNALDGEMIAVDGRFYRADLDGDIEEIDPSERTPFAAMAWFEPSLERPLHGPLSYEDLLSELDAVAADPDASCAIRIDGEFELVRARSVPRQLPPYRPLGEVVAEQRVFELGDVSGSVVGFRFPDYARGLEVDGYHLHFIADDRSRGGHVLELRPREAVARIDLSGELHVELPPGVDLDDSDLDDATAAALDRAERQG
jgi:acetolactate decarboxylase